MTAYSDGTITLEQGSAEVVGDGTAWQTSLIVGGVIYVEVDGGNALPIASVDSDTSITAALKWTGDSGEYGYSLVRNTEDGRQVARNATALAQILQSLSSPAVGAMSAISPAAQKLLLFTGPASATTIDLADLIKGVEFDLTVADVNELEALTDTEVGARVLVLDVVDGRSALYTRLDGDWSSPAFITGPVGERGPYKQVTIGDVDTLDPDVPATVTLVDVDEETIQFNFGLPKGTDGLDGDGAGDVVGPSSAVVGHVALFDNVSGKHLADSGVALGNAAGLNVGIIAGTVAAGNDSRFDAAGKNDALFALEIADLKGVRLGMAGGVADAFDDETGVDVKTNATYDAVNDLYTPQANGGGTFGPSGGGGGGGYNNTTGTSVGIGKTPVGYGGGAGAGSGSVSTPGSGAAGAPGFIIVRYTPAGGSQKVVSLTAGTLWSVPHDWNNSSNAVECFGGGGGSGAGSTSGSTGGNGGGGGGGGGYAAVTNLALASGAAITYQVGAAGSVASAGGDTWFNGATISASSVGAKGGSGGATAVVGSTAALGGAGGSASGGVGTTKFSGGSGGNGGVGTGTGGGGGGGGGASGPNGNGGSGANSASSSGGGGGGANGGASGSGANGGNGRGASGGGSGANPGGAATASSGGGGGGGLVGNTSQASLSGGAGAVDGIWVLSSNLGPLILRSISYTAASQPASGRLAVQVTEVDTVSVNTDLIAKISRDGGSTWATAALELAPSPYGARLYAANGINLASLGAGTTMKWEISTANNKNVSISGVVVQWK